ncbi:MAG: hypothetical protein HFI72_01830 [Peptococcaceae bacterium]|nr:hypothetical protein [Peptococcaceae bacterium]
MEQQNQLLAEAQDILRAWTVVPISVGAKGKDILVTTEAGTRLLKYYPQGARQGFRCHMAMEYSIERGFYSLPRHILNRNGKPLTVYEERCYGLADIWAAKPIDWQCNQDIFRLGQAMGQVHTAMAGFHQAYLEQPEKNWLTRAIEMAETWLAGKEKIPVSLHPQWERVCLSLGHLVEILGEQEAVLLEVEAVMPFVHNGFTGKEIFLLPQGEVWVGGWEQWQGGNSLADLCAVLHKIAWQRNWDAKAMEALFAGYRLKGIFRSDMAAVVCAWSAMPFAALDLLARYSEEDRPGTEEEWQPIFNLQLKKEQVYEEIAAWTRNYWRGGDL